MHSLRLKLILAFILVCLVEAILVAFLIRQTTQQAFDDFIRKEAIHNFVDDLSAYYEIQGSWDGLAQRFRPGMAQRARPRSEGQPPSDTQRRRRSRHDRIRFGLADTMGVIVKPYSDYQPGERVSDEALQTGMPVVIAGRAVGTALLPAVLGPLDPRERDYLAHTEQSLILAVLGALAVALLIGMLIVRSSMRPLRQLTAATKAMSEGKLKQQVPVLSHDELGDLTESFNRMSAELEHANALRRQMSADIAHELRTPLTVLTGYLEALSDGSLPPSSDRFKAMHAEALQLGRLVEELRTLSLADAGELTLEQKAVDSAELLRQCAFAFQQQAAEQGIRLEVEAADNTPPVLADRERLAQVLGNLICNALHYSGTGDSIILRTRAQNEKIAISVQDSGAGIAAEALPHVFERLYRADGAREQVKGGSGLGLAIAKSIVEAHGGSISVASQAGQGASFTILLPAAKESTQAE